MISDESYAPIKGMAIYGRLPDVEIDLAFAALDFSALVHPGLILDRYKIHLEKLVKDVGVRHAELIALGACDCLDSRTAALRDVLSVACGYAGDAQEGRDEIQSADIVSVIDNRMGAPVALAILYLHAARGQGWEAYGLDIPGSFAVRMDLNGERVICDPAADFRVMQAPDLRRMVKRALGPKAELSVSYYEPVSNRSVLVRLQNIIKTRQIEAEDYEGALQSVMAMRAVDPEEYRLLLDQGILCARLNATKEAVVALEQYIERAPASRNQDRHEAAMLLQQLKSLI